MKTCIKNIREIVGIVPAGIQRKQGAEMNETGTLSNAWLLIDADRIAAFGPMDRMPQDADEYLDAEGGLVMPSFCDSHTHIVYAGSRHETDEDELYSQSMQRVNEMIAKGSGAIEIKSGYGLRTEDELKMLRVIRRIRENSPALIRATFLGAHAIGRGYEHEQYVRLVCDEMIPLVAQEHLADFVDVFCDEGFFTVEDTDRILTAGAKYGLRPKIHANELAVSGGVQIGVQHKALSVDHLEKTTDNEIEALLGSDTMPTMLPGSSFFLGLPYGRAKEFIAAGLGVALASDYNPGSSPSGDMRFVMAMGCIRMRLTTIQALNAVTLNSAYAMGVSDEVGSITVGKRANIIVTRPLNSLTMIPYMYQTPFIKYHLISGKSI